MVSLFQSAEQVAEAVALALGSPNASPQSTGLLLNPRSPEASLEERRRPTQAEHPRLAKAGAWMPVGLRPSTPSRQPRLVDARSPASRAGAPGCVSRGAVPSRSPAAGAGFRDTAIRRLLLAKGPLRSRRRDGLTRRPDGVRGSGADVAASLRAWPSGGRRPPAEPHAPSGSRPEPGPARGPGGLVGRGTVAAEAAAAVAGGPLRARSPGEARPGRWGPGVATVHGGRAAGAAPAHRVRRPGGQDAGPPPDGVWWWPGGRFRRFRPDDLSRLRGQTP